MGDMRGCLNLLHWWQHRAALLQGYAYLYVGLASARRETIQVDVEYLDWVITTAWKIPDEHKAELLNFRAFLSGAARRFRGDADSMNRFVWASSSPVVPRHCAAFGRVGTHPELAARDRAVAEGLLLTTEPP